MACAVWSVESGVLGVNCCGVWSVRGDLECGVWGLVECGVCGVGLGCGVWDVEC